MSKPWTLRPAGLEDLPRIYELETRGFPGGIVEEKAVFEKRVRVFPEGFLLLHRGTSEGEQIAGYLCCEIWNRIGDQLEAFHLGHDIEQVLDRRGKVLYIASLTIDPQFRGQGLADKMFGFALEEMQRAFPQLEKALLLVNVHWTSAVKIYRRYGFSDLRTLPGFFTPQGAHPQDGLIMERAILKD